jgi:hypothetical protein
MHSFFNRSKIAALYISEETVEVAFFVTGLATLQIRGVEMSESNVRSFKAFLIKRCHCGVARVAHVHE